MAFKEIKSHFHALYICKTTIQVCFLKNEKLAQCKQHGLSCMFTQMIQEITLELLILLYFACHVDSN